MSVAIKVENVENAIILRFNRPEIKNSLSLETLAELEELLNSAEQTSAIERIIFTGTGGTFASGANLNEIAALNAETARAFGLRGQHLM